jgi:predicted nuclease of predicted toxin-antitoxin system
VQFLLNMNLPRELGRRLTGSGHACRYAGDVGLSRSADMVLVQEARDRAEVILTHDLDYGNLLAFSGAAGPSVVIFRVSNTSPSRLLSRLTAVLPVVEEALQEGAIVVVEDASVRVRRLPLEHPDSHSEVAT